LPKQNVNISNKNTPKPTLTKRWSRCEHYRFFD